MFKATLKRIRTGDAGVVSYEIPKSLRLAYKKEIERSPEYNTVTIDRPHKPRTTGDLSQNHKLYALLNELAQTTGHEVAELKMLAKYQAVKRGYPYRWIKVWNPEQQTYIDQIEPKHEYELSTVECSYLIEEVTALCVEAGIILD
jgi:hypothetical protein